MTFHERALTFDCCGERLVGVVAEPDDAGDVGVVITVGGPQYRVGSHRQFVLLARSLAAAGVTVLRYDYRGMGDATGAMRTFEDAGADIAAAIAAMQDHCPSVKRIVLWGLCDAASSALMYTRAMSDARVAGLVLLNPWVRAEATFAATQLKHYYGRRLLERDFWQKLVRGGVDVKGAAAGLAAKLAIVRKPRAVSADAALSSFQDRMAEGWSTFTGPVLLVLSGRDLTAKEFVDYARADARWNKLMERENVEQHHIPEADHTFSTARSRKEVEARTLDWVRRVLGPEPP